MPELVDVLLLEDNQMDSEPALVGLARIPLKAVLVRSFKELQQFLDRGDRARLYFLDDIVPMFTEDQSSLTRRFRQSYNELRFYEPGARVFYTGSNARAEEQGFCRDQGIEIVKKYEIDETARKHSPTPPQQSF